MLAIMGSKAGTAIVTAAMRDCRCMKRIDRLTAQGGKGQMKSGAGRALALWPMFDREFVSAAGKAVADRLSRLARPDVIPDLT